MNRIIKNIFNIKTKHLKRLMVSNKERKRFTRLSFFLRHCREIPRLADGSVHVSDLMRSMKLEGDAFWSVVNASTLEKVRLEISEDGEWISALQGHSANLVACPRLEPILSVKDVKAVRAVHATTEEAWSLIQESGELRPGTRQHVHFGLSDGVLRNRPVHLLLDVEAALAGECRLFRSKNGMLLCDGSLNVSFVKRI